MKKQRHGGLRPPMKITVDSLGATAARSRAVLTPDGVRAVYGPAATSGFTGLAKDAREAQSRALDEAGVYDLIHTTLGSSALCAYPKFLGYGVLANLTQNGLVRSGIEMRADEMTRKWIEFSYTGKSDAQEESEALSTAAELAETAQEQAILSRAAQQKQAEQYVSDITADLDRYGVRKLFREAAAMSGYFGGCLAYIDVGDISDGDLKTPLRLDGETFGRGKLRGFKLIEPYNIAPGYYNSSSPISDSYFRPETWYVLGTEIHASRFLYFSENRPPTLLLPSYNFFGIPLAQIVLDVVLHFTQCREASARLLTKFSTTVFKTDMQAFLAGESDGDIQRRLEYFVQNRDNDGVMLINNDTEDIIKIETPLGGVTDIVKQSMEMVAAAFGEPVTKLWGISPGGFNSTGESDMQNHYEHINSIQERILREPLTHVIRLLQLDRFGEIDDALTFNFIPLGSDDERALADCQKVKADTAAILFDRGIVSGEEVRRALTEDSRSQFTNIDAEDLPEEPDLALPAEGYGESETEGAGNVKRLDLDYGGTV